MTTTTETRPSVTVPDAFMGTERTLTAEAHAGGVLLTLRDTGFGTVREMTLDLDPAAEVALLDFLTDRANVKRDAALREMHSRRYFRQGQPVTEETAA